MGNIEVKLLHYTFTFRRLKWREEFAIKQIPLKDPIRVYLAHALNEVSGLKPKDFLEAMRVIDAVPKAIINRVWKIYKGGFPASRRFLTGGLYSAPDTQVFMGRVAEDSGGKKANDAHASAMSAMEAKYTEEELRTERENDRKIFDAIKKRDGLIKATQNE